MSLPDDSATADELARSYESTRAMLAGPNAPNEQLLLKKPLEPRAGGAGHKGVDDFGRNIFASPRDPDYQTLLHWALGTSAVGAAR